MGEKKKKIVFKFTEEEITMYNSMLTAAVTNVFIKKALEAGIPFETLRGEMLSVEYIKGDFQEDLRQEIDDIAQGNFDLELFKYEEEDE